MPDLPLVGTDFAGYRLRSVLGRGGMSIVYQAENPRLRSLIALKVLAPELAHDQVFRARFREESQIAASLNHPNVIPIHDFGSSDGLLYIAMRYVSGTDLRQLIAEQGRLAPHTAVYLLEQAARALDAAHSRGLVHRDVKPGNLLIAQGIDAGDPDHVYLADFGITKQAEGRSGLTTAGTILGTVHYMSPEQIQELTVRGTADQYSLGCVLYECLTGRAPFEKSSNEALMWAHVHGFPVPPSQLRPELPPAVDEVFTQVLAKHPGDRYASCREFIAAAGDALATACAQPGGLRPSRFGARDTGARGEFQPAPLPRGGFPELAGQPHSATQSVAPPVMEPLSSPWQDPGSWHDPGEEQGQAGDQYPRGEPGRDEEPPPRGPGRPPARRRRVRGRGRLNPRIAWSLVVLAIAAGTAGGVLASQAGRAAVGQQRAAESSPPPGELFSVLEKTAGFFPADLRMSTCVQKAPTWLECTNPSPAIASVTFKTFPSLAALYSDYQEIVDNNLPAHQPFSAAENMHPCSAVAPNPTGESTWNHSDQYLTKYSVAQLASGKISTDVAMGRVFCTQKPDGSAVMVWTQNSGKLLGYATGGAASHEQVWNWFYPVHHNIIFPGQPGMTMPPGARPSAQATPG